jgi:putative heme-binding domain-containing protein
MSDEYTVMSSEYKVNRAGACRPRSWRSHEGTISRATITRLIEFPLALQISLLIVVLATPMSMPSLAPALCAADEVDADADPSGLDGLVALLGQIDDADFHLDVLKGMHEALTGRKNVPMPAGWRAAYAKLADSSLAEVRERATALALIFGDRQARDKLQALLNDQSARPAERAEAIQALAHAETPDLAPQLHKLLAEPAMQSPALRGLAVCGHESTPQAILQRYGTFDEATRRDAVGTLASRPAYALALLDALERNEIPSRDVSAFTIRQLQAFGNETINARINEVWGAVRQTSHEKGEVISKYTALLTPEFVEDADLSNGRLMFNRSCAQCHRLFGEGGTIGPDLTGSNRANLDYILHNVVAPSDVIGKDYQLQIIVTTQGRLMTGIVSELTAQTIAVQTANERIILDKADIEEQQTSNVSMMPEGLFDKLTDEQIRDLVGYLAAPGQVDLPPDPQEEPAPATR